jgi:hypothetical protein
MILLVVVVIGFLVDCEPDDSGGGVSYFAVQDG